MGAEAPGLALVRVRDIAEAAGVSPRTYNKEEAICAFQSDQARRLGRALLARPAGEPLGEAITAAVLAHYDTAEPDRAGLRMIMNTPALEGAALKAFTTAEGPLAEAIAERSGHDELFARVTAAAVAGAIRVAGRHWIEADGSEPFADVLRRALAHVVA